MARGDAMNGVVGQHSGSGRAVLVAVALALVVFQASGASQGVIGNLTFDSGQSVVPHYHGWEKLPNGTIDVHFGYLNRNWEEELDIPIGPENEISAPFGPDAGQPTHFLPRANRWQFKVNVPAAFLDSKQEVVWTLTSRGNTLRAYSNFHPVFVQDEFGRQNEFYGSAAGNTAPKVVVEGSLQRTAKVGEAITLTAVATDDGIPAIRAPNGGSGGGGRLENGRRRIATSGSVGGSQNRGPAFGLRFAWYLYRGVGQVKFNPPPFKVWEDNRAGADSPFSPAWLPPAVPEGNRWVYQAVFTRPGTFVLRGQGHDGLLFAYQDVTVTVTP